MRNSTHSRTCVSVSESHVSVSESHVCLWVSHIWMRNRTHSRTNSLSREWVMSPTCVTLTSPMSMSHGTRSSTSSESCVSPPPLNPPPLHPPLSQTKKNPCKKSLCTVTVPIQICVFCDMSHRYCGVRDFSAPDIYLGENMCISDFDPPVSVVTRHDRHWGGFMTTPHQIYTFVTICIPRFDSYVVWNSHVVWKIMGWLRLVGSLKW